MDLHQLNTIAAYSYKLFIRSLLFKIFLFVSSCAILFFQMYYQSSLLGRSISGMFSLDSFIPFMNFYLLVLLQTVAIIFLSVNVLSTKKGLDTVEVFYCRSESNTEYVWGICLGIIRAYFVTAIVFAIISGVIQSFFSLTHFDVLLYIFYLLLFFLPSLVFVLGFFVFLSTLLRNSVLAVLLFLFLGLGAFCMDGIRYGIFDVLALKLPNTFSEIVGFPNMHEYVLQRMCWLFLGLGFIHLTTISFDRIPNNPKRKQKLLVIILLLGTGVFAGVFFSLIRYERCSERQRFASIYDKYSRVEKAAMLKQDIRYKQKGAEMNVSTSILLQNQTGRVLDSIILYLNPALEIISLKSEDRKISFGREGQVVRVNEALAPGDSIGLQIMYGGKINENVCYLDVVDKEIMDPDMNSQRPFYFGKNYCFLSSDFTLLLPEVLWYPTTCPPVNPSSPYNVSKDYVHFTLDVSNLGNKTVISQGEKTRERGRVLFHNLFKMPGLSLCIGDYETKSMTVDSVTYTLNLFREHVSVLDWFTNIDSCFLAGYLKNYMDDKENKLNRAYPFKQLIITESPVSFASYFRNENDRTEFVQPELVFLPEKGVGIRAKKGKLSRQRFTKLLDKYFFDYHSDDSRIFENVFASLWKKEVNFASYFYKEYAYDKYSTPNNPYCLASQFLPNTFMASDKYPCMNVIAHIAQRGKRMEELNDYAYTRDALSYLASNSLNDALSDKELPASVLFKILALKSRQFTNIASAICGMPNDTIISFVGSYMDEYKFEKCDFAHFQGRFAMHFEVDLTDGLEFWFNQRGLPDLIVRDCSVRPIRSLGQGDGGYPLYVQFKVYNNSDADGVISVESVKGNAASMFMVSVESVSSNSDFSFNRHYYIKAGTGLDVAFVLTSATRLAINTNLSNNIPAELLFGADMNADVADYTEYVHPVGREEFYGKTNEIIVDNRDSGFKVVHSYWPKLKDLFVENDGNYPKYKSEVVVAQPSKTWAEYISHDAYGEVVKSAICCEAGSGGSRLEWHTNIKRGGTYELFIYLPNFVFIQDGKASAVDQNRAIEQEYLISCENNKEIRLEKNIADQKGWISLGKYNYSSGPHHIFLTNRGRSKQTIVGDAVKWVYQEDNRLN